MKKLYEFFCDFGRMGELECVFIADEKDVENAIGQEAYFGEVLGKHSEVILDLETDHFEELSEDQNFIEKLETVFPTGTICGINPLNNIGD